MTSSWRRIWTLSRETLVEIAVHNRWIHVCGLGLLVFLFAGRTLTQLPLGSAAPKLLFDFGLGSITILGGLVLVVLLPYGIHSELQSGAAYAALVRRLSRSEYLWGKLLGSWLALMTLVLAADCLLALLVHWEMKAGVANGSAGEALGLMIWAQLFVFQACYLLMLSGVTVLMTSLSSSFLFASLTSVLIWLMGLIISGGFTGDSAVVGLGGYLITAVEWLVPRMELGQIVDNLWYEGPLQISAFVRHLVLGVLYIGLLVGASILVFSRREL